MGNRGRVGTVMGTGLVLLAVAVSAKAVEIRHESAPCAVAGEHPLITARLLPVDGVTRVRVVFHGEVGGARYAVPLRPEDGVWSASLPRPRLPGARFAYAIVASGAGSRGRSPAASAYVVDVRAACEGARLPASAEGPVVLEVPSGAPLVPEGFDGDGIGGFVEMVPDDDTSRPVRAAPFWAPRLVPLTQVRISTIAPPDGGAEEVRGGEDWVTVETPGGRLTTYSRDGETIQGRIERFEEDAVVLTVDEGSRVRVRADDIERLKVRQEGSPGRGIVGALAGAAGGFAATLLICVSGEMCESEAVLWAGTFVGAALGGFAGGSPEWRSVTLARKDAWSLELQPRPRGAALRAAVEF